MKVILLKGIPKVGKPEEVVEVNEGFARNSLFPRKLAVPATEEALKKLQQKISGRVEDKAMRKKLLDNAIDDLKGRELVYYAPANDQGSLFSKITAENVAAFLMHEHRLDIDAGCIEVPAGGIKKIGDYDLRIQDGDHQSTLRVRIESK
jgi:large subunit ribosomal protein L9